MNPINIFQMMKAGPQQFIQQMMGNNNVMSNPIARNLCKEKGIDFDKAFSDFKNQFPLR